VTQGVFGAERLRLKASAEHRRLCSTNQKGQARAGQKNNAGILFEKKGQTHYLCKRSAFAITLRYIGFEVKF